jgi:hypothetical protein
VRSLGAQLLARFMSTLDPCDCDSETAGAERESHASPEPFAGSRNEDDARFFGHGPIIFDCRLVLGVS